MVALVQFATLAGLTFWIPGVTTDRSAWIGARFLLANLAVIVGLYFGNVVLSIPLTVMAWLILLLGLSGLAMLGLRLATTLRGSNSVILISFGHPVLVFAVILGGVLIFRGGLGYLPYLGDEFASWLRLSRQIFLADAFWSQSIDYHHGAYTNGWPLMVAWSNALFDSFAESRASALQFFLHLGLIGLAFDIVRWIGTRSFELPASIVFPAGWFVVLILLGTEASWILMPTDLLIDRPLLYVILAFFMLGLLGQFDGVPRLRLCIVMGFVFAAGYLIKAAMLTVGFVAGIFWLSFYVREMSVRSAGVSFFRQLADRHVVGMGAAMAAGLLAPLALANTSWSWFRQSAPGCLADPGSILRFSDSLTFSPESTTLFQRILVATLDYGDSFKLPLTIFAVAMLIYGLMHRRILATALAIGVFVATYMGVLQLTYLNCLQGYEADVLNSLQRYLRLPIRVLHFIGIFVAALLALRVISMILPKLRKAAPRRGFLKLVAGASAVLIIAGIGWQAALIDRSVADMAHRTYQNQDNIQLVIKIKDQAAKLRQILAERNIGNAVVSVVEQNSVGAAANIADYYGINVSRGRSYFTYTVKRPFSWTAESSKPLMKLSSKKNLLEWWREFDVIWPIKTDPWVREVLVQLVGAGECSAEPERFFIIRQPGGTFDCIPKT